MSIQETPLLPSAAMAELIRATRQNTTATIAAGIMAAAGRPFSIQEALTILGDIEGAMYPEPNSGRYAEWAKTREARLTKVYGAAG